LVLVMNICLFSVPSRALFFIVVSFLYLFIGAVYAQTPTHIVRKPLLSSADSTPFDDYGVSVALAGNVAMIGVPFDSTEGFNSGAVYFYTRRDGVWVLQQTLTASDAAPGDQYGWSVALEGHTAVVGARFDDDQGFNSGSVYVYTRSGKIWREQQKLTASEGWEKGQYGNSVALAGETALIGSPFTDDNGSNSGSAYIYTRSEGVWSERQKLIANDNASDDQFGWSVALHGNTALVGARFDDDKGLNSGSAYLYHRHGERWEEQQKITASDGAVNDQYAWSVALEADRALIGARFDDDKGINSGSAYIYHRRGEQWIEQQKLVASDGQPGDQYGWSVSLARNTVMVGAPFDGDRGYHSGSAYIYTLDAGQWGQSHKFTASDGLTGERYGIATDIDGEALLIGADIDYNKGFLFGWLAR